MIKCPRCGFSNFGDASLCSMCGRPMAQKIEVGGAGGAWKHRVDDLAIRLAAPWRGRFERALELLSRPPDDSLHHRPPLVAASASLIPGLGQLWNGQRPLAAFHFGLFAALLGIGVRYLLKPISDLFLLAAFLWVVWSMSQACVAARLINGDVPESPRRAKWKMFFIFLAILSLGLWFLQYVALAWIATAILCFASMAATSMAGDPMAGRLKRLLAVWSAVGAWIVLGALLWVGPHWLWRSSFRLHAHGQVAFAPFIRRNDRVFFEGISLVWRPIQLGDIVLYDPERYASETPSRTAEDAWDFDYVNMETSIERVVGLPGDVVERRGGLFYRNGELAPPLHQPLVQNDSPDDFVLPKVPPGHFAILMSYGPIEWAPLAEVKGHKPVRKAAPPQRGKDLERISIVPSEKIFGRALMILHPWSRRRWLDGAVPEARPTGKAPIPKEWTMGMLMDG
jgi:signal peptidase I